MKQLSPDAQIFLEDSWMVLGNIFASLLELLAGQAGGEAVSRRYYNFVLRRLRAGEAMLRRMILMLALTLEVAPIAPRKPITGQADRGAAPAHSPRREAFGPPTPTPFLLWERSGTPQQASPVYVEPPRIWTPGMEWRLLPSEQRALQAGQVPAALSLQPLQVRLKRLELALRNPEAAAQRLAKWRARQAGLRALWREQYESGEADPSVPFGRASPLGRARRLASRSTLPADYRQWLDDLDTYARDELINSS